MSSCKTHNTSTNQVKLDSLTTYNSKVIQDSIFVYKRDSIIVKMIGDTMFVDRYHTDYRDVYKLRVDTFYKDKNSYFKVNTKTVEYIEKELKWWQKALIYFGLLSIVISLIYLYIKLKK